jgi:hypothetical protein
MAFLGRRLEQEITKIIYKKGKAIPVTDRGGP